jgi:hypothetical protein
MSNDSYKDIPPCVISGYMLHCSVLARAMHGGGALRDLNAQWATGRVLPVCAQMQLEVGGQADLEWVMWE